MSRVHSYDIVPVLLEPDYAVLRLTFEDAEPLTVGCLSDCD